VLCGGGNWQADVAGWSLKTNEIREIKPGSQRRAPTAK
jgi:hypothetical protein